MLGVLFSHRWRSQSCTNETPFQLKKSRRVRAVRNVPPIGRSPTLLPLLLVEMALKMFRIFFIVFWKFCSVGTNISQKKRCRTLESEFHKIQDGKTFFYVKWNFFTHHFFATRLVPSSLSSLLLFAFLCLSCSVSLWLLCCACVCGRGVVSMACACVR